MMSSGGGSGGPGGGMGPGVGGGGDGRHDDEAALTEFLSTLMDYTPMIPDELVEHYLDRSGFQCPDLRLTRLVAVATQKFLSDIASDSLQEGGKENRRRVGGEGAIKAKNPSCCHPCWLRWENDVS